MKPKDAWTRPKDLEAELARRWDRGELLRPLVPDAQDALSFPLPLRLRRPTRRELSERFDDVRQWIAELERGSHDKRGFGYQLEWEEVSTRSLGKNRVPLRAFVPTHDDAIRLVGKRRQAAGFERLTTETLERFPALGTWLAKKPLRALEHAAEWNSVLAVIDWFRDHPRSELYPRQIDIPGVDTKFMQKRRGLLSEILDEILDPAVIDTSVAGARHFEQRYGLLSKPSLVRFRILDPTLRIQGLSDISATAAEFSRLDLPVRQVFIAENETNGLAFPSAPSSIVVFGLGYDVMRLRDATWLRQKGVDYWGDIDTHGFAMLSRLRSFLPRARSVLMDRETLLAHRPFWVTEPEPFTGDLPNLSDVEAALYEALRSGELGENVRLEQERIGYSQVEAAIRAAVRA